MGEEYVDSYIKAVFDYYYDGTIRPYKLESGVWDYDNPSYRDDYREFKKKKRKFNSQQLICIDCFPGSDIYVAVK